jgi:hypothetical protein
LLRTLDIPAFIFSFIFVSGHARVRGNGLADRLAGMAVIPDGRAMDHADVFMPSMRWEEWRTNWR